MKTIRRIPALFQAILPILLAVATPTLRAAEKPPEWRKDYNAARKEALEKNKPLFIDIGTEDCYHCRRLDGSTFRDPEIVSLLNEHFIPLKIDATREAALVQALRIQLYPTMIIAGNDGRILGFMEGYLDAARLKENLTRGIATAQPDWMARDYNEATKAISAADYARAVTLLRGILEDGKTRPVQTKANQTLLELEQQALTRLARAKSLEDKGQSAQSLETLTELIRRYPGTQAANDGAKMLTAIADKPELRATTRSRRAIELLVLAREEYKAERWIQCLDHCELLGEAYRDLPEGREAVALAADLRSSPERLARIGENLTERMAVNLLALSESWERKGNADMAMRALDKLVRTCPDSPSIRQAELRIARMTGKAVNMPVQFTKE